MPSPSCRGLGGDDDTKRWAEIRVTQLNQVEVGSLLVVYPIIYRVFLHISVVQQF